jgi:hypothetical protein
MNYPVQLEGATFNSRRIRRVERSSLLTLADGHTSTDFPPKGHFRSHRVICDALTMFTNMEGGVRTTLRTRTMAEEHLL